MVNYRFELRLPSILPDDDQIGGDSFFAMDQLETLRRTRNHAKTKRATWTSNIPHFHYKVLDRMASGADTLGDDMSLTPGDVDLVDWKDSYGNVHRVPKDIYDALSTPLRGQSGFGDKHKFLLSLFHDVAEYQQTLQSEKTCALNVRTSLACKYDEYTSMTSPKRVRHNHDTLWNEGIRGSKLSLDQYMLTSTLLNCNLLVPGHTYARLSLLLFCTISVS